MKKKTEETVNNVDAVNEVITEDAEVMANSSATSAASATPSLKDVCGQKGCFSYQEGRCQCLSDTDFGGRACPFFKTVKQYEKDLQAHPLKGAYMEAEDDFLAANKDLIEELASIEDEAERIEREGYEEDTDSGGDDDDWDDEDDEGGGGDGECDG